jgi:hypothetical protein
MQLTRRAPGTIFISPPDKLYPGTVFDRDQLHCHFQGTLHQLCQAVVAQQVHTMPCVLLKIWMELWG